jgi:hypothetical protein
MIVALTFYSASYPFTSAMASRTAWIKSSMSSFADWAAVHRSASLDRSAFTLAHAHFLNRLRCREVACIRLWLFGKRDPVTDAALARGCNF